MEDELTLMDVFKVLAHRWKLIVAITLVPTIVVAGVLLVAVMPTFTSTAVVIVSDTKPTVILADRDKAGLAANALADGLVARGETIAGQSATYRAQGQTLATEIRAQQLNLSTKQSALAGTHQSLTSDVTSLKADIVYKTSLKALYEKTIPGLESSVLDLNKRIDAENEAITSTQRSKDLLAFLVDYVQTARVAEAAARRPQES